LLTELNKTLYDKFDYAPNTTKVDSPIDDALRARRGVCQDFAHIMIALVRQLKIPCRSVSGYLYRQAKNKDRSPAGATYAWVETFLGEAGWIAFDPANNLLGCERHIHIAVGRDYADVPPTRGVYKGEAESEPSVRVTVSPVDAPQPHELPSVMVLRTRRPETKNGSAIEQQQQQIQQQESGVLPGCRAGHPVVRHHRLSWISTQWAYLGKIRAWNSSDAGRCSAKYGQSCRPR